MQPFARTNPSALDDPLKPRRTGGMQFHQAPALPPRLALLLYPRLRRFPRLLDPPMIPRYSRPQMTQIWEPENRYRIWLDIELSALEAMAQLGIVPETAVT